MSGLKEIYDINNFKVIEGCRAMVSDFGVTDMPFIRRKIFGVLDSILAFYSQLDRGNRHSRFVQSLEDELLHIIQIATITFDKADREHFDNKDVLSLIDLISSYIIIESSNMGEFRMRSKIIKKQKLISNLKQQLESELTKTGPGLVVDASQLLTTAKEIRTLSEQVGNRTIRVESLRLMGHIEVMDLESIQPIVNKIVQHQTSSRILAA